MRVAGGSLPGQELPGLTIGGSAPGWPSLGRGISGAPAGKGRESVKRKVTYRARAVLHGGVTPRNAGAFGRRRRPGNHATS